MIYQSIAPSTYRNKACFLGVRFYRRIPGRWKPLRRRKIWRIFLGTEFLPKKEVLVKQGEGVFDDKFLGDTRWRCFFFESLKYILRMLGRWMLVIIRWICGMWYRKFCTMESMRAFYRFPTKKNITPPPTIGVFGPNSRDFLHMPVPVVTFHAIWLPHCHQFPWKMVRSSLCGKSIKSSTKTRHIIKAYS